MSKLKLTSIILGKLQTNCYFLSNIITKETVIIDPADCADKIKEKCAELQLTPVMILLTHGHFDHMLAAEDVKKNFQIPIYAPVAERELMNNPRHNLSLLMKLHYKLTADKWIADKYIFEAAGFSIEAIATPGHTAGSMCYYIKEESLLITGDTIFKDSYGRTDIPSSNYSDIVRSIRDKIFCLPENTTIYPGHGEKTTIAYEKANNIINNAILTAEKPFQKD